MLNETIGGYIRMRYLDTQLLSALCLGPLIVCDSVLLRNGVTYTDGKQHLNASSWVQKYLQSGEHNPSRLGKPP